MARVTLLILVALIGVTTTFARPLPYTSIRNRDAFINSNFSPDALMQALLDVGIQHPEIAYCQSLVETGEFTSKIFKLNHNLFGMKLAVYRQTTAIGERFKHARFNNWLDAVKDYKLWQDARLKGKLVTTQEYLINLKQYAADKHYVAKVRKHLAEQNPLSGNRTASNTREVHAVEFTTAATNVEYLWKSLP